LLELCCFASSMVGPTTLLFFCCFTILKIRSVRMLDAKHTIVYDRMFGAVGFAVLSGLGRRYTHPGRWIHLPFRGHRPYRLRSNNGSCSWTNDDSIKWHTQASFNTMRYKGRDSASGIGCESCRACRRRRYWHAAHDCVGALGPSLRNSLMTPSSRSYLPDDFIAGISPARTSRVKS
jgi:hypothetical protein